MSDIENEQTEDEPIVLNVGGKEITLSQDEAAENYKNTENKKFCLRCVHLLLHFELILFYHSL